MRISRNLHAWNNPALIALMTALGLVVATGLVTILIVMGLVKAL